YLKGICYSHDPDQKQKALPNLYLLKDKETEINGYNFNLAYALVKNDSIQRAIEEYKKALAVEEKKGLKNDRFVNEINMGLQHCYNIVDLKEKKSFVKITNLGMPINTKADEYSPLIPSNEEMMIYTYRGPNAKGGKQTVKGSKVRNIDNVELFYEDIFMSTKINDTVWSEPKGIEQLNTLTHDAAVSLNSDGTELFIYKNRGEGKGDLYLSELNGKTWTTPVLQLKLNSPEWDGSACFIPNEDRIIFASERKGGYGGKDLYYAERVKDNMWTNIKNLGSEINSKFDEDAPFVTSDGRILFFSSNNKNSIGGYDIFRSDFINGDWQTPYNLGQPINTTNDDNYFTVRADGKVAYYSSLKPGGDGGQDIYKVEPGIPGRPVVLLQVEGLVTLDGKPSAAEVEIRSMLNNRDMRFKVNANKLTGKFLSNLAAGDEYELLVTLDQFAPRIIKLSTANIDSFVVLSVFAEFTSPTYTGNIDSKNKTGEELTKTNNIFDKNSYSKEFGNVQIDGLTYEVQLAAYKFSENFNYNGIVGMPKIVKRTDKEKINRFTIGSYRTYNEAFDLLKRVQENKIADAFITATYKGERKLLYQLVEEKIMH
ncbi:MAG: PD40 domain-containing protein, partial [Bacteroidia bacterium]|nr:PD40 domain-containing protein [Bacteroidia bacterium]